MTKQSQAFGKVAVLLGGTSAERDVSLKSGQAVLDALVSAGVDAHAFDVKEKAIQLLITERFDRAFIILHGRGGEDGTIQGALDLLGVPYTGSGVLGSALAMDKIKTKQVWQALGLPTAHYLTVKRESYHPSQCEALIAELGDCIMVKPAQEGSSIGMSKVSSVTELKDALALAFQFDEHVLLEQFITGKEYTVAVLNGKALPSIRMHTPHAFYDYSAKYQSNSTEYHCPSDLSIEEEHKIAELAISAFNALNASGWGRVDFMQDRNGLFYLLEANTVPGMTQKSLVPMAAKVAGLTFSQLSLEILATSERA